VIDLHLHTTASDGLLTPAALIARAADAGLTIVAITDHDTVAGVPEAEAAAAARSLRLVIGIEITAVEHGQDVHILGYFFDPAHPGLAAFLRAQRSDRVRRVKEMGARLRDAGVEVDVEALLARAAAGGTSIGRPAIADALVATGCVADRTEAFDKWLGRGKPAFVPRCGASGADVIRVIHEAGGIASLAHPGVLREDALIPVLADAGLDAIEVWHSDHAADDRSRYAAIADQRNLCRSGGSDFHGDGMHRAAELGVVQLPPHDFDRLEAAAARARRASHRDTSHTS
jgi:3',5'-nucleoside bisphosphate phosphatase